jgi:predicted carbohydrate-binding protein with CBM5 and CBM33 domain
MQPSVSPVKFFETMHAYQQTAALKAAIELELFTEIEAGTGTVADVAHRISAPERASGRSVIFSLSTAFCTRSWTSQMLDTL